MTQLAFTEGFTHLPTEEEIDALHRHKTEETIAAIDDIYTNWVLAADYEAGNEGRFWADLFDNAVYTYEQYTGVPITPEERQQVEQTIRADCELLAECGFDEEIFEERKELARKQGDK